jgi:hypothetical protein
MQTGEKGASGGIPREKRLVRLECRFANNHNEISIWLSDVFYYSFT